MDSESHGIFGTSEAKEKRRVFDKNVEQISDRQYNIIIGLVLLWGLAVNAFMCNFMSDVFMEWNPAVIIIGYFVSCFAGTAIVHKSKSPLISFIGYTMIVLPIGAVLSIALKGYDPTIVGRAAIVTAIVTVLMLLMGAVYPKFFLSIGRVLFFSLLTVVIIESIMIFGFRVESTFMDWIVVIIFCGYIGYDWAVANEYQRTVDNAVDSATDLYLDIINIFIRLVSIFAKNDD